MATGGGVINKLNRSRRLETYRVLRSTALSEFLIPYSVTKPFLKKRREVDEHNLIFASFWSNSEALSTGTEPVEDDRKNSVIKRFNIYYDLFYFVFVPVSPIIFVPNQLVGAPAGTTVMIDCHTEAHPRAISYWNLNNSMVLSNEKYSTETKENSYRTYMRLTIRNLTIGDFGTYQCISKNSLGETEGTIRLYGKRSSSVYNYYPFGTVTNSRSKITMTILASINRSGFTDSLTSGGFSDAKAVRTSESHGDQEQREQRRLAICFVHLSSDPVLLIK